MWWTMNRSIYDMQGTIVQDLQTDIFGVLSRSIMKRIGRET
jgi:hypothetical protein